MVDFVKVVNEDEGIHGSSNRMLGMYFDLQEPLFVGWNLKSEPEFQLMISETEKSYLIGFKLILKLPDVDSIKNALKEANRFVALLSAKAGKSVTHKHPITFMIIPTSPEDPILKIIPGVAVAAPTIDLDAAKLTPFLRADSDLNSRLMNLSNGLAANEDGRFAQAAQSFHQIIENTGIPEEIQYRPIRHAVSHQRLDRSQTVADVQSLGFNCTIGSPVDFADPDNHERLRILTQQLKVIAQNYIMAQLQNLDLC